MTETRKTIPEFQSEDEELSFWSTHDSTEYVDWTSATVRRLPKLKATANHIAAPARLDD